MKQQTKASINAVLGRTMLGSQNHLIGWLELVAISMLAVLLWRYQAGLAYSQAVDYFYWPMLGPVLIALRYGFGRGLISLALLIIVSLLWIQVAGLTHTISLSVTVGTALITMIVGEFRDNWQAVNERTLLNHQFMEQRLESFTQSYHLLKISHDQLEQRLVGKQGSLRTAVQSIQQLAKRQQVVGTELAQRTLQVLNDIISLYGAAFYQIKQGHLHPEPLAVMGEHHGLVMDDPMLADALQQNVTVAAKDYLEGSKFGSAQKQGYELVLHYQMVIPLVNVLGQPQALITVDSARFVQLTDANVALVHLVASYVANFISHEVLTPILQPQQRGVFNAYVEAQKAYFQHYRVDSVLVIFHDISVEQKIDLEHATDFRRGADVYWLTRSEQDNHALCVLLPMATLAEAERFIGRIKSLLEDHSSFAEEELEIFGPVLINQQHEQVTSLLSSFGTYDEDFADLVHPAP